MDTDHFEEKLAQIRLRYASTLRHRVDESFDALPALSDESADAIKTIINIHRKLHEMCGMAPSIGFPLTGKAARLAESVLREPASARRPLTKTEIRAFIDEIDRLRDAALAELQAIPIQHDS